MDLDRLGLHHLPSVLPGHPSAAEVRLPVPVVRRYARARTLSGAAAIAVILLGCSVLAGWLLGNPTLKSGIPGLVAMNPATALAFVLAGVSLLILYHGAEAQSRRVVARVFAALVIVVALLCLSRLYTPWDLGPDRLLFSTRVNSLTGGLPNRMAPNTALNFLMLGSALLLLDYRTRSGRFPAHGLAFAAGALAFTAAVGYALHSRMLYGVGAFIPMAMNTALGFLILATGVLSARPANGVTAVVLGNEAGGLLARRLLPAAVVIPLVLAWVRLRGEQIGLYDTAAGVALLTTATILIVGALIWRSAVSLNTADLARTEAEEKLRELNEQLETRVQERAEELRALFEESPLPICSLTLDGHVRSWNRAAEQLFGWAANEVIGCFLPIVPPDLLNEYDKLRKQVLAGHPTTGFETTRVRKDGAVVDVSVSTAALHDATGTICGVVAVYADIRSRKALEAQLRQSQKMEAVGRLAGGVAHDFNNLLTVIRTGAEFLLADLPIDDARRADAAEIGNAATRAAALTRQLLAFSRQQMLQLRIVDVNTLVTELEPMLHRLVEENIAVVTSLAPTLDRVKADPHQLEQVLVNLVVNARDAMPRGGTILIETANVELDAEYPRAHLDTRPGPHVALTVTDSGSGMDAATQARIFEPFFTTKGPGQGTGLGLATAYGIVRQCGGHIWVYSEVGQGTTFKMYFPQYAGAEEVERSPAEPAPAENGAAVGATILIVEDDGAVRSTMRRLLERVGYRVVDAATGPAALATIAESPVDIDLVISDMVMPEMSGLQLRQRVREVRPTLPVLLMSGYTEEAITRLGGPEPIPALIEKPFTAQGMLAQVKHLLTAEVSDA